MSDANELMRALKQAAVDAVRAEKPVSLVYGTVKSAKPLTVITEQQLLLEKAQLVLTRSVMDYTLDTTCSWTTSGGSGDGAFDAHTHKLTGGKITVKNGLKKGEKVIMIREQGGQRFIVLDRVAE